MNLEDTIKFKDLRHATYVYRECYTCLDIYFTQQERTVKMTMTNVYKTHVRMGPHVGTRMEVSSAFVS